LFNTTCVEKILHPTFKSKMFDLVCKARLSKDLLGTVSIFEQNNTGVKQLCLSLRTNSKLMEKNSILALEKSKFTYDVKSHNRGNITLPKDKTGSQARKDG